MGEGEDTPLSRLVREKLAELHIRQTEFCKITGFDQGLLSKIQNSQVTTLSLESALKLAVGLKVKPRTMLELIGRPELNNLVREAYADELGAPRSGGVSAAGGEDEEATSFSLGQPFCLMLAFWLQEKS